MLQKQVGMVLLGIGTDSGGGATLESFYDALSEVKLINPKFYFGAFQLKVIFFGTLATQFLICAIGSRQENSFKLLRVEMENYSMIITMGMY